MSSPRKILLVDDSAIVRAVVTHALTASGFQVAAIEDPRALDEAVAREKPDLLLVDATFPDISDESLVQAIQNHVKNVPVFLFSDRARKELESLIARSGAAGAISKEGATLAARISSFFATGT